MRGLLLSECFASFFKINTKVGIVFSSSNQQLLTASKLSPSKEMWSSELKPVHYYVDICQLQTSLDVTKGEFTSE